jgi:two-component system, NtrC family, sensor kinase
VKKQPSITRKLRRIALVTCGTALAVACICLFVYQLVTFRQGFIQYTRALASGIASSSFLVIDLKDDEAAESTLAPIAAQPNVVAAAFLLADESVFFAKGEADKLSLPETKSLQDGYTFSGWHIIVKVPVVQGGRKSGAVVIISEFGSVLAARLGFSAIILAVVTAVSLFIAYLLSIRMQRTITDPLAELANTANQVASQVAKHGDYSMRATKVEDDECGLLIDAFNSMLQQIHQQAKTITAAHEFQNEQLDQLRLEISERQRAERELAETHRVLMETSRQAGMAEIATGVLHNVGNVLNSVNVSVNCITELVAKSKVTNLSRLTTILPKTPDEFAAFVRDNDKGKVLPSYLPQLGIYLADEFAQIARETGLLGKNIEHIKDIISRQQTYAKVSGIIESHDIQSLIEDALELNADAFHRHAVEIVKRYERTPRVAVDKHKVLQILINLLQNAKHAVCDADLRRVTIHLEKTGDTVKVSVSDTGMGIRPENLTKIFTHGFTTRKDGHGFGLHSGANAAKEMGGQLSAKSEGEGKGATFTLSVPIAKQLPQNVTTRPPVQLVG